MKRLTEKDENGKYFSIVESVVFDEEQQCINKLGQKEDDDDLGVDSHLLFKALKSKQCGLRYFERDNYYEN